MIPPVALQTLTEIMHTMAEIELLIAELYRTCADTWKEDREFWLETVAEEEKHAAHIKKMIKIITAKPERFEVGRPFNQTALKTIKKGLKGHLELMQEGRFSREKMLNVARDIEASLVEKSYGEIVQTNDVEYQTLMKEIVSETVNHKKAIEMRIAALN